MNEPKLSVHALRSLLRAVGNLGGVPGRKIGGAFREKIVLHVSSMNRCYVCSVAHGMAARLEGLGAEEIHELRRGETGNDARTKIALRYAELRTTDTERDFPEDVQAFEEAFGPEEQREVRAIVDLFTFNNRFNNTWEAILPGAQGRRRKLGIEP